LALRPRNAHHPEAFVLLCKGDGTSNDDRQVLVRRGALMTVGSKDDTGSVRPARHCGAEGRLPWADIGTGMPVKPTKERW
jgi:hypothetical protein